MLSNYNMGTAAIHFHSCHGPPSPPTAVEVPVNFDFLYCFQCVVDGFFVPDGRQLVAKPSGFMSWRPRFT